MRSPRFLGRHESVSTATCDRRGNSPRCAWSIGVFSVWSLRDVSSWGKYDVDDTTQNFRGGHQQSCRVAFLFETVGWTYASRLEEYRDL
jgi:hypothetical protein